MAAPEPRREPARGGTGTLVLLALAGVAAATWAWNRQDEEALRLRTAERLRPFSRRSAS